MGTQNNELLKKAAIFIAVFTSDDDQQKAAGDAIERDNPYNQFIDAIISLESASEFFGEKLLPSHKLLTGMEGKSSPAAGYVKNYGSRFGIITTLTLPESSIGFKEENIGILVAVAAKLMKIPVVVCNSVVNSWGNTLAKKLAIPLVEGDDWDRVVKLLRTEMKSQKH